MRERWSRAAQIAGSRSAALALALGVFVASFLNAALFTVRVSNPVIERDAWYFLFAFLSRYFDGSLQWTDYFIKRAATDSALPVQKALMLANAKWGALDFRYEAFVGLLGTVVSCVLLIASSVDGAGRRLTVRDVCVVSLIPLLMFSLSSVEIYEWSLVALFNVLLPAALALFAVHRTSGRWRSLLIFAVTVACLVVLDNSGQLACVAAAAALTFEALRGAGWRNALARVAPMALGVLAYRAAYPLIVPSYVDPRQRDIVGAVTALIASAGQFWKGFILPAVASNVEVDTFRVLLGRLGDPAIVMAGLLVLSLHVVFWVSSFRTPAGNHATFMAVCLMLWTYGATAGVIVERVPEFGWSYLEQHRYTVFYRLTNIAMVMQWLAVRLSRADHTHSRRDVLPVVTLTAVVLMQTGLSALAWPQAVHIRRYEQGMAQTVFCLADYPQIHAPVCEPLHAVCRSEPWERNYLVGVLKHHRLNVFSERFQRHHGMQPIPDEADRCLPPGEAPPMVVSEIVAVRFENNPANGARVLVGAILGRGFRLGDRVVINDGSTFATVLEKPSVMTFSVPASLVGEQNAITLSVVRPSTNARSRNVSVTVSR